MMKKKLEPFWARSWMAVVIVVGPATCLAGDVADKLADLEKQREKISTLHTVAKTTTRLASGSRESKIETWEKKTDRKWKLRREIRTKVVASQGDEPSETLTLMVNNGTTAWRELPITGSKKLVLKGKASDSNEFADVRSMLSQGEAKFRGDETVLDQPCVILEVKGKEGTDRRLASYWISERYGVVLKSIVEGTDQSVAETRVTEFKVDDPVEDKLFLYSPPADAQVIDSDSIGKKKDDK